MARHSWGRWLVASLVGWSAVLVLGPTAGPALAVGAGVNGRVAYVGSSTSAIWVADPQHDGAVYSVSGPSSDPNVRNVSPTWSPDGNRLAFLSNRAGAAAGIDIYVVNADGTGLHRVTTDGGDKQDLVWSPDGTRFAYRRTASNVIKLVQASGGPVTGLSTFQYDPSELDWSPDGNKIVFSGYDWLNAAHERTIQVLDVREDTLTPLTQPTGTSQPAHDLSPAWSPDGTQVVYQYRDGKVYRAPADGSGSRTLVLDPIASSLPLTPHPTWSPDGQRILFNGQAASLESVRPDGTDARVMITTNVDLDQRASWGRAPTCLGKSVTLYGTPVLGKVTGTSGADVIAGWSGNDVINAGGGNDTVCGGGGNDTINGEAGSDAISGGPGADTVTYAGRSDAVVANLTGGGKDDGGSLDGVAGARDSISTDVENLTGGSAGDRLSGNASANVLSGGPGADVLDGRTGRDRLLGGSGLDSVTYAGRSDAIVANLTGGTGDDGGAGDGAGGARDTIAPDVENLSGGNGNDQLSGNGVGNRLTGGPGADRLLGLGGNDVLLARDGFKDLRLDGGTGTDTGTFDAIDPARISVEH